MATQESSDTKSVMFKDVCTIPMSQTELNIVMQTEHEGTPDSTEISFMQTMISETNLNNLKGCA